MINTDIIEDFRWYAREPARWCENYLKQCSPKIARTELTEDEFNAIAKAAGEGTLKVRIG